MILISNSQFSENSVEISDSIQNPKGGAIYSECKNSGCSIKIQNSNSFKNKANSGGFLFYSGIEPSFEESNVFWENYVN